MSGPADYVVLHPDGTASYGSRAPGQGVREAIGAHVPNLSTQGVGRVQAWFADDFTDSQLPVNPLAYQVLAHLGYRHPSGWYGPVAVTMEEDMAGNIAPLASDIHAAVDAFCAKGPEQQALVSAPAADSELGATGNPGARNRIELAARDGSVAGREIVIGWDRGLGTYFAQVLDGTDEAGENIVRVDLGGYVAEVTDPLQAIDAVKPYAQIPDDLVEILVQQRNAPGALQRSPFAAWAQKALPPNTHWPGAASPSELPEPAAPLDRGDEAPVEADRWTGQPQLTPSSGAATEDLIEATFAGESPEFTADPADDGPWNPPPRPGSEYGPHL